MLIRIMMLICMYPGTADMSFRRDTYSDNMPIDSSVIAKVTKEIVSES